MLQKKQMEDFIMLFNDLTTRCFDACVDDFKSNSLQRAEVREEKKSFDLLFFLFCLFFGLLTDIFLLPFLLWFLLLSQRECTKKCINKHFKVIEQIGKQYQEAQDLSASVNGKTLKVHDLFGH